MKFITVSIVTLWFLLVGGCSSSQQTIKKPTMDIIAIRATQLTNAFSYIEDTIQKKSTSIDLRSHVGKLDALTDMEEFEQSLETTVANDRKVSPAN